MKHAIQWLKALSDENRLRIVRLLMEQEVCVCELADALELGQSNLSRHLATLKQAGLVSDRKEGTWVYYTLAKGVKSRLQMLFSVLGDLDTQRTRLDQERLHKRLALRVGGKCLWGYRKLPPSTGRGAR